MSENENIDDYLNGFLEEDLTFDPNEFSDLDDMPSGRVPIHRPPQQPQPAQHMQRQVLYPQQAPQRTQQFTPVPHGPSSGGQGGSWSAIRARSPPFSEQPPPPHSVGHPTEIFHSLALLSSSQPQAPSHISNPFQIPSMDLVMLSTSNPEQHVPRYLSNPVIQSEGSEMSPLKSSSIDEEDMDIPFDPEDPIRSPGEYNHPDQLNPHEHPLGEHPSRTLFVRNINSNVEDEELKKLFEVYGTIRNMYTQCKHRGFVMISYFDIRHAKNAMRQLQGKLLRRRRLDIHYSIPKENPPERDQNQGTLVVFNLDSSTTNEELKDIFGAYGEIKEIRETPNKKYHKFIEFYDVRDADKAMKNLNKTELNGKKIKIEISRPGGRPKVQVGPTGMSPTPPSSAPGALSRPSSDLSQSEDEDLAQSLPAFPNDTGFSPSGSFPPMQKYPSSQTPISPPSSFGEIPFSSFGQLPQKPGSFSGPTSPTSGLLQPAATRTPSGNSLFSDTSFSPMSFSTSSSLASVGPSSLTLTPTPPPSTISPPVRDIHRHRASDEDKIRFALNISKVRSGQDVRTTLMIKNIPNKYSQKMLLTSIDVHNKGLYDFFYLPIDFKNKCNVGYAFINFMQPVHIIGFYEEFNNKKWEKFNSDKVCEITYARIQGKMNLIQHFQNSSLMSEDKKCRPMIFHSEGPFLGEQESFPLGPKLKQRPKEETP